MQRPDKGLLANLWEAPSVVNKADVDIDNKFLSRQTDEYLKKKLGLGKYDIDKRERVGDTEHVFSHIKQTLYVEYMRICGDMTFEKVDIVDDEDEESDDGVVDSDEEEDEEDDSAKKKKKGGKKKDTKKNNKKTDSKSNNKKQQPTVRWVKSTELNNAAISKQMKKCFALVDTHKKGKSSSNKKGTKRATTTTKKKEPDTKQRVLSSFFKQEKRPY